MAPKQEIIPPSRAQVPARREAGIAVASSRVNPGGVISSAFMRWTAERHARTLTAVAVRARAEGDLFAAQTEAMESFINRQRTVARVQELAEIIETDRANRRAERAEERREQQHLHEIAETRRLTALAQVERELVDAEQAVKAQRDHGYGAYELEWKKRSWEILNVELGVAEKRAMLREHYALLDESKRTRNVNGSPLDDDAALEDALYAARAELLANGLDTSRIDSLLGRKSKR